MRKNRPRSQFGRSSSFFKISHVFTLLVIFFWTKMGWTRLHDEEAVDLRLYPSQVRTYSATEELTLGDLHGNTLKLFYFLISEGVIQLDVQNYNKLVALYFNLNCCRYSHQEERILDVLATFREILEHVEVLENGPKVRLIGDEVADRGEFDYLTLLLIDRVKQAQLQNGMPNHFEILFSNHGIEFLHYYVLHFWNEESFYMPRFIQKEEQVASILRLENLMGMKDSPKEELIRIIHETYLPSLKLLSYSEDANDSFSIYTHAPVGLEAIEGLAGRYGLEDCKTITREKSKFELISCIDRINLEFHSEFGQILQESIMDDYDGQTWENLLGEPLTHGRPTFATDVLGYISWNDPYINKQVLIKMPNLCDVNINYVHGHAGGGVERRSSRDWNLDNLLGKSHLSMAGRYHFWVGGKP